MLEVPLVPAEKRERRELQVSQDATTTEWALAMIRTTTAKDRVVSTADQVVQEQTSLVITRSSAIAEGPRDASRQLQSCQLPRNSAETTRTTSAEQIEVMKLEG